MEALSFPQGNSQPSFLCHDVLSLLKTSVHKENCFQQAMPNATRFFKKEDKKEQNQWRIIEIA